MSSYSFRSAILGLGSLKFPILECDIINPTKADDIEYSFHYDVYQNYIGNEVHFPSNFNCNELTLLNNGLNTKDDQTGNISSDIPYSILSAEDWTLISDYSSYPYTELMTNSTTVYGGLFFGGKQYTNFFLIMSWSDESKTTPLGMALTTWGTYYPAYNTLTAVSPENTLIRAYLPAGSISFAFYAVNTTADVQTVITDAGGNIVPGEHDIDTNPYASGGNSEGGIGGTGTFKHETAGIDYPTIPAISAVSAGMISLYVPSVAQMRSLASYMWTPTFYDTIIKLWADPMDAIIGLSILPFSVGTGSSQDVKVGNISTGISMPLASAQYQEIDCGSLAIPEYWGAALDYDPYTRIQIYLPYIGIRELNTDDVMNKTVQCKYRIDILSGACSALLKCGTDVLYQFNGQCASNIPLSATNYTGMIQSAISAVGAVALGVASGGASAPISAAMVGGAVNMGAQAANSAINSKPRVQHSGQMGGAGGLLAVQTPYIIVTCPKQSMPKMLNKFEGYPSNINAVLSSLTGYTQIETIRLSGLSCTEDEKNELYSILQKGVIL